MNKNAPIILFVYNRPDHTLKTIEYLKKNFLANESDLFIFSDGPKNEEQQDKVLKVRNIIKNVKGFKSVNIVNSEKNKGLANSIIEGVSSVINKYGKVIVLEDDLITSKYFLTYMNEALNFFSNEKQVWSVSGYTPPLDFPESYKYDIYQVPRGCSWGWGTWKKQWNKIDWEVKDYFDFIKNKDEIHRFNKMGNELAPMLSDQMKGFIDSWAIRWYYNQFKNNSFTIYPRYSFVENRGFRGDSTHGSLSNRFDTKISEEYNINFYNTPPNEIIMHEFSKFFNLSTINYFGRFLKKIGMYKIVKKMYKNLLIK